MKKLIVPVLTAVFALACSKQSSQQPSATSSTGGEQTLAAAGEPVLLTPGSEPRQRLYYQLEAGRTETLQLELVAALAAATGDAVAEAESLPVRLTVVAGPTEKVGKDRVRYTVRVTAADVAFPEGTPKAEVSEVQSEVAPLRNISGWVEVDAQGVTRKSYFSVPDAVTPRTRTLLGNIRTSLVSVPFPKEAVGSGARWKVRRTLQILGVNVEQELTYTLATLPASKGRLELAMRQTAAPQRLLNLEPGVEGQLEAYETSGVGSVQFDLTHLTPWSEADGTTQMRATMSRVGQKSVNVDMRLRVAAAVHPVAN